MFGARATLRFHNKRPWQSACAWVLLGVLFFGQGVSPLVHFLRDLASSDRVCASESVLPDCEVVPYPDGGHSQAVDLPRPAEGRHDPSTCPVCRLFFNPAQPILTSASPAVAVPEPSSEALHLAVPPEPMLAAVWPAQPRAPPQRHLISV